jgi:ABC-type antimicrobial peptide transport system permease subunit
LRGSEEALQIGGAFTDLAGFDDGDDVFADGKQASTPEAPAEALTVLLSCSIANAILYESGLSFLGLGAQPPQSPWGTTLASAKSYMFDDPWYSAIVGVTLSATIIALNLVGDANRETFHPLLSGRE